MEEKKITSWRQKGHQNSSCLQITNLIKIAVIVDPRVHFRLRFSTAVIIIWYICRNILRKKSTFFFGHREQILSVCERLPALAFEWPVAMDSRQLDCQSWLITSKSMSNPKGL